jgi:hypothetical protein
MGLARQSVQRVADILVERGLAEYRDNPALGEEALAGAVATLRTLSAALDEVSLTRA